MDTVAQYTETIGPPNQFQSYFLYYFDVQSGKNPASLLLSFDTTVASTQSFYVFSTRFAPLLPRSNDSDGLNQVFDQCQVSSLVPPKINPFECKFQLHNVEPQDPPINTVISTPIPGRYFFLIFFDVNQVNGSSISYSFTVSPSYCEGTFGGIDCDVCK